MGGVKVVATSVGRREVAVKARAEMMGGALTVA